MPEFPPPPSLLASGPFPSSEDVSAYAAAYAQVPSPQGCAGVDSLPASWLHQVQSIVCWRWCSAAAGLWPDGPHHV